MGSPSCASRINLFRGEHLAAHQHGMTRYERPYHGQSSHRVTLFDTEWELPLVELDEGTYIASDARLVLGETTFVTQAAAALSEVLEGDSIDYLVTPEAKALPLTQVLAQHLSVPYAVARKSVKEYMHTPVVRSVDSITTDGKQQLVLNGPVADELQTARVCLVDDVVSTGGTLTALESLLSDVGAEITAKAAVFEEGTHHPSVETLASLPLFKSPGA